MCYNKCRCKTLLYENFCSPKYHITMKMLEKYKIIEYITVEEQEYANIAIGTDKITIKDDYSEIHGSLMFSLAASTIVYPEFNQAARNNKQANIARQAIGIPSTDYRLRYDTEINVASYIEKPICQNKILEFIIPDELNVGEAKLSNFSIDEGTNQEDSFKGNKKCNDLGQMIPTSYKSYSDITYKKENLRFAPMRNVDCINQNGIPIVNSKVDKIILNKQYKNTKDNGEEITNDITTKSKFNSDTQIDNVSLYTNMNDEEIIRVKERLYRKTPHAGNKFSERNSQKMTVGEVAYSVDIPYLMDSGIIPGANPSPHGIPSRMTISVPLEMYFSKLYVLTGDSVFKNSTPHDNCIIDNLNMMTKYYVGNKKYKFNGNYEDLLSDVLKDNDGKGKFIDGRSGKLMKDTCFYGFIHFQQLEHFSKDKLHVRKYGKIDPITRQGPPGKQKNGGIRMGQMENRAVISHGASSFLHEKTCELADARDVYICGGCGSIVNTESDKYDTTRIICRTCRKKNTSDIIGDRIICRVCNSESKLTHKFNVPYCYSCKSTKNIRFIQKFKHCHLYMSQLLKSMCINTQYHLSGIDCDLNATIDKSKNRCNK